MTERIPKRRKVSQAILQSLAAGVVPGVGLENIAVGRKDELSAFEHDLDIIADGGSSFRLIVGRYGSGKSFMLQMLRNAALQKKFVVAHADISPQSRLTGSKGEGLALYRELLHKMAIRTRPGGNAFAPLLEKWIDDIQRKVVREGSEPNSRDFDRKVAGRIHHVIGEMEVMIHGYDFGEVLNAYWRGHRNGEDEQKRAALRWLLGEFHNKSEARKALDGNVRVMIDDSSWYDYIKLMAYFVRQIGYRGLIICIDEAEYLLSLSHKGSRENNYKRLLNILNDTLQGNAEHLGMYFGATPDMVEDRRRGLFSYEALQTRLEESRFAQQGLRDMSGPMIRLDPLRDDQIFSLLGTIRDIHAWHNKYEPSLGNSQLHAFMAKIQRRVGADSLLTPREVLRDYVALLNLLQNTEQSLESLLDTVDFTSDKDTGLETIDSPYASFQI